MASNQHDALSSGVVPLLKNGGKTLGPAYTLSLASNAWLTKRQTSRFLSMARHGSAFTITTTGKLQCFLFPGPFWLAFDRADQWRTVFLPTPPSFFPESCRNTRDWPRWSVEGEESSFLALHRRTRFQRSASGASVQMTEAESLVGTPFALNHSETAASFHAPEHRCHKDGCHRW